MMEIKKIDSSNLEILNTELDSLIDSFSFKNLKKLVEDDRSYFFIAYLNNLPIGYALAYKFPSLNFNGYLSYLYDIEVLESHRKKGIGRELITNVLASLKSDGVTEVWLGTATNNIPVQTLFQSTGAEKSEEVFHDYTYIL